MNRKLVIAAVATSALAVGGTTVAFAGGTDDTASSAPATAVRTQSDDDGRADRGDDARDDDRGEDDGDDDRRDDARALAEAKVSATEAVDAALASVNNGKAESVELEEEEEEEEDGRAFWETDVLGADGTWYEVRVDAHTGDVLQKQAGDDDGRDDD